MQGHERPMRGDARALHPAHRSVFMVADVLFTGAVLGGGADSLHKLVQVFTNFMDATAELAKKRKRRAWEMERP